MSTLSYRRLSIFVVILVVSQRCCLPSRPVPLCDYQLQQNALRKSRLFLETLLLLDKINMEELSKMFWAESFWLPGNHSWEELKNTKEGVYYPQATDLLVPLYLSFFFIVARIAFEKLVAEPLGFWYGLKGAVRKASPNPVLEAAFAVKKAPTSDVLQTLSKKTELSRRQIERWFRIRRNQERTPVLKKFKESAWRCFYYFIVFWYGLYMHLEKPWFYETKICWKGWPSHSLDTDVYWYYLLELGFYFSLLFSLFTDVKRKDFMEMIVHHIATIVLLSLSWVNNFVRIGTLNLLVHDAVDSWMEMAKMAKYVGYEKLCEGLFFTFMVVWVLTRMIIFPFRVIYSTMFEAMPLMGAETMPWWSMHTLYNGLLMVLQVLHIIWFYYICLIAKDAFTGDKLEDSRSSMESASDSAGEKPSDKGEQEGHVKVKDATTKNGLVQRATKKSS